MNLTGNLKKQADEAADNTEKKLVEKAGMRLTDDELEMVAGGTPTYYNLRCLYNPDCIYKYPLSLECKQCPFRS